MDTLLRRVKELAITQPDKEAVIFKKETVTYGQLYSRIKKAAAILSKYGVKRGDRVLFTALSKPETIVTYLGIQFIGGVVVYIDKNATPENAASIYEETTAALFLTDKPMKGFEERCTVRSLRELYAGTAEESDTAAMSDEEYELPAGSDPAEMLFTTGTTGKPKGVILSYKAVFSILSHTAEGIGIREDERVLIPLPLNHSYALRVLRAVLYRGATVILQNGFTFAKEMENNIVEHHCSALITVPASLELTRNQMQEKFVEIIGTLRYVEVGAGSLTIHQRKEFTQLLSNTQIFNTWGSSETGGALFTPVTEVVKDPVKVAAIGKPLPDVEVHVIDADGSVIEHSDHDHPGRLAIKGDMIMSGYWGREDLTKEAIVDGWLYTNDLVYTDAEGYVYMLGRVDDIINVGGEKVSPIEVENIASECPGIKECACIGVDDPNEVLGQIPALFMAVDSTYTEEGLKNFLAGKMERYKLPQEYVIIPELPRNRMKKIDRKAMRKMWAERGKAEELMNPVVEAILSRHSIRKFTDQPISDELLKLLLKAGYHAPSGHNMQTWQFTVVRDREKIERLKTATQEAAKANKVHCYGFNNPTTVILVSNDKRNADGCQDASCAAENILLAAHACGLGAAWINALMTLRDASPVKEVLDEYGVPARHTVWSMIALGYPAEEPKLLAKKETVVKYV